MAINIGDATVGHDTSGSEQLLKDIKINTIDQATDKMKSSLSELESSIDSFWTGKSADTFKQNMENDVNKIIQKYDSLYEKIKNEVEGTDEKMISIDENLVKGRG